MAHFKIRRKLRPVLIDRRLKRLGAPYYELCYWVGSHWTYKEFETLAAAKEFVAKLA